MAEIFITQRKTTTNESINQSIFQSINQSIHLNYCLVISVTINMKIVRSLALVNWIRVSNRGKLEQEHRLVYGKG